MLKKLITTAMIVMAPVAVAAPFALEGDYIKIGVNDVGTIGSNGNASPGILYDNTGTRTFNTSYDYLTPGSPFEGWTVKYNLGDGSTVSKTNNNASWSSPQVTGTLTNYSGVAFNGATYDNRAYWSGGTTDFDITHDVRFNNSWKYIDITTGVAAKVNMTNLYFGRFTDPDARAAAGDSSATTNTLGYSPIPTTQVVFSEALVSKYALGLYSAGTNVGAGISRLWSTDPAVYHSGTNDGNGDYTIGLGFKVDTLNAGDQAYFRYAYIFGPSTLDAGATAVSSGAGGGTAGVVPGCTTGCDMPGVTPPAPSAPTVVSSTTGTLFAGLTVYNRLPQTKVLGIRKTDSTTSTTVTTDTYSDGSEVITYGTPVTTDEVAMFNTKIDQLDKLATINNNTNYSLDSEVLNRNFVDGDRFNKENKNNFYLIGNKTLSNKFDGYKYDGNTYGLGMDWQVENNWIVGAQYTKTDLNMTGENAGGSLSKNHVGLYSAYLHNDFIVKSDLGLAVNDYKTGHSLPELGLANTGSAKGKDMWFSTRVYAPDTKGFRPFAGVRVEKNERDAVTEKGDSLTAMSYDALNKTKTSADLGLRYEKEIAQDWKAMGEYAYNTQNIKSAYVGVGYQPTNNSIVRAKIGQVSQNGVDSNTAQLEARIYF